MYSQVEEIYKEQIITNCCMGYGETKQDAVMEAKVCLHKHPRVHESMYNLL